MTAGPFIQALCMRAEPVAQPWLFDVPAVKHLRELGRLELAQPVTVITGDNGVGKSTLLNAIARGYGYSVIGGTYGNGAPGPRDPLYRAVRLECSVRPKQGYFLRGDTHFGQATRLGNDGPGLKNLHHMSHGESILEMVEAFIPDGVYLLDEPEAGLSAVRQLALLSHLHSLAEQGAQIVVVTHSPILLAIPGAHLIEIKHDELVDGAELERTDALRAMRDWLADPVGVAQFMIDVTAAS
ncbi:AAA family ATPase [Corynebacterium lipophiloflavum]|uniref:AAA+ ATPase domain-containing protein n=1 Tax=Corynebacterium lipophiloflavum (strain ATCC 700352 / DSM 44291 / CCUG 37336 / JCM 10383 / DMMZ 1944) TaxID=525263 RepID=C0XQX4_CORLD|nr:AAA family ATPase [Corynebacterium lipophiloflavum]EEI17323.1 hypothetical protein HMPREF0298_0844 [Corynebacterium lipophiloflavum DSM 44291]